MQLLSFRELRLRLEAYQLQERADWNRALLISNSMTGAGLTYEDLQNGRGSRRTTKEEYEDLKDQLL